MIKQVRKESAGTNPVDVSTSVLATFLTKLAKHLALIGCFMIIGISTGRMAASSFALFLTIVSAAVIRSVARTLEHRLLSSCHRRLEP